MFEPLVAFALGLGILLGAAPFVVFLIIRAGKPSVPPSDLTDEIRKILMPVITGFQDQIDQLDQAAPKIAALVAASQPGSASAQDVADTLAAVTTAVAGVNTALTAPPA